MVGAEKVVVYSLGNSNDVAIIAGILHKLGYLVASIHRVVTAVVEEITNIVFFEDFEQTVVVRGVILEIFELISHRTERRRRSIF